MESVEVTQVQRRPHPDQRSIELVFATVRAHLPPDVVVHERTSSHLSTGLLPRLRAVVEARRLQGQVTHVVGDVHYLTLLMRRRRTVLTVHDTEFLSRAGGLKRLVYSWLWLRLPVLRSAVVTVPSEASRADLVSVVGPRADVRVVLNPVRPFFVPADPPPPRARPRVLLMGTWPNKNVTGSAAALRGLDVDVVLVGPVGPAARAALDEAVPGWVSHPGLDDAGVLRVLHDCDLLLFPSTSEGFGLPIVEAQASGRPVVTSARAPMDEVAGGAARLVDPDDPASIRAGVLDVLGDPALRARLVADGLVNARRFDPDEVAAAYARIYREVAGA